MRIPPLYSGPFVLAGILSWAVVRAEIIGMDAFDLPDGPAHGRVSGVFWDFHQSGGHQGAPSPWCSLSGDPEFKAGRLLTPAPSKAVRTFAFAALEGRRPGYAHNKPGQVYNGLVQNRGSLFASVRVTPDQASTGIGLQFYDWNSERVYIGALRESPSPLLWGIELGKSDGNGPKPEELGAFASAHSVVSGQPVHLVCEINWPEKVIRFWLDPKPGARTAPSFSRPYSARNWISAVGLSSFGEGEAAWDDLAVATRWDDLP
jgi:hypothetical protein